MSKRALKIEKSEYIEIKKLLYNELGIIYKTILFRKGYIKGKSIIKECNIPIDIRDDRRIHDFRQEFFKNVCRYLIEENLVINALLKEDSAIINGSFELDVCKKPSCDFIRGVLTKIYEIYYGERVICKEVACEAINNRNCVFIIELSRTFANF